MVLMLCFSFGEDKYIINKHHNKLLQSLKHIIHRLHEVWGCVSESKRHNSELIMAIHGGKGYLLNILFSNRNLIIPRLKINLGKYSSPFQSLKQHLNMG